MAKFFGKTLVAEYQKRLTVEGIINSKFWQQAPPAKISYFFYPFRFSSSLD